MLFKNFYVSSFYGSSFHFLKFLKTAATVSTILSVTGCVTTAPKTKSKHKTQSLDSSQASEGTPAIDASLPATTELVAPAPAPAAVPTPAPAAVPTPAPGAVVPPVSASGLAADPTDPCDSSVKFNDGEPVFLPESRVMLTRVTGACLTKTGAPGHKRNAGWMAMGFPCTGGEGRIDWKGTNYARPKMVSFLLETSCAMGPTDPAKIREEAHRVIGVSMTASMLAFSPFNIQYWEVPGYADADTSFIVELRSGKGIDEAWVRFIKPKPLRIIIVGRENAWVEGNNIYSVEGDLTWVNKNRFTFKVENAQILKGDDLNKVRTRCEELKPQRDCSRVF
jgi:hypothetical protein